MSALSEMGAGGQARLVAWLADNYTDDGIATWWAHYRNGDEAQRRRMLAAAGQSSEAGDGFMSDAYATDEES